MVSTDLDNVLFFFPSAAGIALNMPTMFSSTSNYLGSLEHQEKYSYKNNIL